MVAIRAMNVRNSESQNVGNDVGADVSDHEHGHAPLQVYCGIVERADIDTSGDEASIEDSNHESSSQECRVRLVECLSKSDNT